jgi:hypothetical protein
MNGSGLDNRSWRMAVTILPVDTGGIQRWRIHALPFGQKAVSRAAYGEPDLGTRPLGVLGNVLWVILAGWWLAVLSPRNGDHPGHNHRWNYIRVGSLASRCGQSGRRSYPRSTGAPCGLHWVALHNPPQLSRLVVGEPPGRSKKLTCRHPKA